MHGEHISRRYDSELEAVRALLLKMGGLVEQQIRLATEALFSGDVNQLTAVIEGDYQVNKLEMEIDEMCSQIIARRQPAASDLRELMVVGRACTDLERMGDAAKKIARLGQQLAKLNPLYQPNYRELKRVSALARTMLSRVLDAFARHDLDLAQGIVRQDDEVDNEYRTVMRHLVAYMIDDPRAISTSLEILFIAKAFEQIGDHARSIAQQLVYLVNGRDGRISSE